MFDVGGPELIVILLAALILFGPKKIPEIAQYVGKGMRKVKQAQEEFQKEMNNFKDEINETASDIAGTANPNPPKNQSEFNSNYKSSDGFEPKKPQSEGESQNDSPGSADLEEGNTDEKSGDGNDVETNTTRKNYLKNNPYNLKNGGGIKLRHPHIFSNFLILILPIPGIFVSINNRLAANALNVE